MLIAVIADTHDRLPSTLGPAVAGADAVWHLGDVTREVVLDLVRDWGKPTEIVRGNCDPAGLGWPEMRTLEVEGFRVCLVHIPPRVPPAGCDLLLHGHTHVPRDETVGPTRFLNPGCITRPNRGAPASFGWLELRRGEPVSWRVVPLESLG